MKIGPQSTATTAISASSSDTILIRGHDLCETLIGGVSFTDYAWLLIAGHLPSPTQRQMLDATLVSIAEHGLVPSVQAARMTLAAAPDAIQGAVAAGLLGCGSVILGAAQSAGEFLVKAVKAASGSNLEATVREHLEALRRERRPIPGFGHPLHKGGDPRTDRLFYIAEKIGSAGPHLEAIRLAERALPAVIGRPLPINVSGAIAAVLLDVDFPVLALKGVPLIARVAGLIGHLLEETNSPIGFQMSHAASSAIRYSGPAPQGFVADEN